eukprot:Lankesteria_metandrocarpae@DN826_c0_g1_i1.p1
MSALDPTSLSLKSFDQSFVGEDFKLKVYQQTEWSLKTLPRADVILHCVHSNGAATNDTVSKELTIDADIDKLSDLVFSEIVATQQFTGKEGAESTRRIGRVGRYRHATLLGLGAPVPQVDCEASSFIFNESSDDSPSLRSALASRAGKAAATNANTLKAESMCIVFKGVSLKDKSLVAFIEGLLLGCMKDDRYTSKKATDEPSVTLLQVDIHLCDKSILVESPPSLCRLAQHTAYGIDVSRQLTTAPPNYCNPETLSNCASELALGGNMDVKVLQMRDLESLKMGAFVAVGQGSATLPRLIHITYTGEAIDAKPLKKLAFIGKGVTMDTGGYNIKTMMMELMKFDMGGAAAVIGAACSVSRLKPKGVQIHFIVGAAENMISCRAYRPGDIVTASNGTTIEIGNTDAEGRLVLCDCLVYAQTLGVDFITDLATLTGASMVALGRGVGCLYGTNSKLTALMLNGAQSRGELLWPMPLHAAYRSDLDSRIADVSNCAPHRYGGSIHAALFLKDFVKSVPWCHIDMAGPTWDYKAETGTGFGVRTVVEFCLRVGRGTWPV